LGAQLLGEGEGGSMLCRKEREKKRTAVAGRDGEELTIFPPDVELSMGL